MSYITVLAVEVNTDEHDEAQADIDHIVADIFGREEVTTVRVSPLREGTIFEYEDAGEMLFLEGTDA